MKKTLLTAAVALTGLAAFSSANALPTYNDGDVFLGIRDKTATKTYVIDLGSFDNYYNNANPVTPYSLNQGFTAAALASDLTTQIGTNWYSNANVVYGLFGGFQAGSSSSSISGIPDNALIVGALTSTRIGNIADQTIGGLTGYAAAIGASSQTGVGVSTAWVNNNGIGTWDAYQYGGFANAANNQGAAAYGWYPGTLETQVGNALYANTVYSSDNTQNSGKSGAVIGTVTLASDGTLSLNAVPEPSTYVLFGLGALALMIIYRRRNA